jgi:gamma-glutamyltranspeptidase/glutathione hydrolase
VEKGTTSHLSVIDGEGNAVAMTTTVNYYFGSCVVVPGTGILLNDEMDDFDRAPGVPNVDGLVGAGPNAIAPGKIPLSSMAPTLVFDPDDRLVLVIGAAGGARIPTAVVQAILHVIDDGMRLDDALAASRIHHQGGTSPVEVEANGLEAATVRQLEARGYVLQFVPRGGANAQAVGVTRAGLREAAADPRYEGSGAATP